MAKTQDNSNLSEELLKHFLDVSLDAIAIKDESLKICHANLAYCELHNTTADTVFGTTGFEHLSEELAAKNRAEELAILNSGETLEIRENYPLSNSESFQFSIKKSVLTTSNQKKYLIIRYQDLSTRGESKDEPQKSSQALEVRLKKLEEQNRFKDAVLEFTSDAIVLIDEHGTFLYRSSGVEKISGYQDSDLLGSGIFRIVHPDDLNDALNTLRSVIERPNIPVSFEHRIKHQQGHYIWLEGTAINYISDSAVGAIVLNYRDVTWRKTSLTTSSKDTVEYEQLFTSMADMFHIIELVYNDDGKPIDFIEVEVNPAVEKLYGLPSEKIIGQRITSIVGAVEDYWLEVFDTVVKTGKPAYFENYNKGLDRYYRINAWQTPDKKLAVIFADITPRKHAELDLQRNSGLLQDAQSIAKLGGWELDLRTNQIYWTEETYQLHEVDPKKWVPTVENGVSFYTPTSQKIITQALEEAITNKEDFDVECQFVTAKGNLLDVRATGKTVVDDGKVIKILGVFQDISDRKKAERELLLKTMLLEDAEAIAKLGGWELDLKTDKVYWTENTYLLHELDPKTWVPTVENGLERYSEESKKLITEALEKAIEKQGNFDVECQLLTAKDNLIDVRVTGTTVVEGEEVVKIVGVFQDITGTKSEELELKRKTLLLEESHKIANMGAWEVDLVKDVVFFSDQTFTIHELSTDTKYPTVDEAIGYYTNGSQEIIRAKLAELLKQEEETFDLELKLITANGNELDVRLTGRSITEGGVVVKAIGVLQDISERVARTKELENQRTLLSEAQKLANMGAWELDLQTNEFYFTEQTALIHGLRPTELNPPLSRILNHHSKENQKKVQLMIEEIIEGKRKGFFLEIPLITENGTEYQVRITAKPVFDNGKAIKLVGFVQNITEFQRVSEELARQQILLQDASRLAKVGGWELDIATGNLFWTAETYRIHETSPEEFNPTVDAGVSYFLPNSKKQIEKALDLAVKKGIGYDLELDTYTTKGSLITVRTTCQVTKKDGKPVKLTGSFQDITHIKQAEREKEKQRKILEESQRVAKVGGWTYVTNTSKAEATTEFYRILEIPEFYEGLFFVQLFGFIDFGYRRVLAKEVDKALKTGKGFDVESKVRARSGEIKDVRITCSVIKEKGEAAILNGTLQDITSYKQLQREIEDSQRFFSDSQNAALIGSYRLDVKEDSWASSRVLDNIFGVPDDYKKTVESWSQLVHPEDRDMMLEYFQKTVVEQGGDFNKEYRIVRPANGETRWVLGLGKVKHVDNQPVEMVGTIQDITNRKKLQQEIEESQLFFRESQKAGFIGSYRLDIRTEEWKSSEVLDEIFGISSDYTKTIETWSELVHPDDRQRAVEHYRDVIENKKDFYSEYRVVRPANGEIRWVLEIAKLNFIDGEPVEMIGTVQDITKRKKSEEALQASEARLRQVTYASRTATWEIDIEGTFTYVSPNINAIFGFEPEDLIGKVKLHQLTQTKQQKELAKNLVRPSVLETIRNLQIEFSHKNGSLMYVEINAFPNLDQSGKHIGYQGSAKDITERVIQQKEIVKLSEVVSQNPAAVVITDLLGNIEYVNRKFEQVTGYNAREVVGKNPRILSSGELPKSEYTKLWNSVLGGKPWSGELHNVKKDGTKFWERALIAPLFDDNGKVVKLMGLKVDITAEKKFQDELESTLQHLEELVDERTESLEEARKELEVAHKSLLSSLQYAQRIQQANIPSPSELRKEVSDAFVIFKPRDIVSGDFYWYHKTDNGLILSLVDCTGHGVPGAMLSMIGFDLFDYIIRRRKHYEPASILERFNYGVVSALHNRETEGIQDGMDMSVVNIDYRKNTFTYSSAKSYGLLVSGKKTTELEMNKESIGGVKTSGFKRFEQSKHSFKKGDKLYLFSDGFADQFGGSSGKKFMRKRLHQLIVKNAHLDMKQQKRELELVLRNWMKGYFQVDDITLIGIEL